MNDRKWVLFWEEPKGTRTLGNHYHTTYKRAEESAKMIQEKYPSCFVSIAEIVKEYQPI
jgi:archaellum biogenesis protein FlaJ (TadC family)